MNEPYEITISTEMVKDLHWMARRYADWRSSCATSTFNNITRHLLNLGVKLNLADDTIWARDAMGHQFGGLSKEEHGMGMADNEGQMWQDRIQEAVDHHTKELKLFVQDFLMAPAMDREQLNELIGDARAYLDRGKNKI